MSKKKAIVSHAGIGELGGQLGVYTPTNSAASGQLNKELIKIRTQRYRLFDILNRHVRAEDDVLTDRDFILKVFHRWSEDASGHIGDPADSVILDKEE